MTYKDIVKATGYGTGAGLMGWNCRHSFFPVIPGIDEPKYTKEELENIDPPPKEIDGEIYTYYEAEQQQRYMERIMRKTKRELVVLQAAGDEEQFIWRSILLRGETEEYVDFCEKAGLIPRPDRYGAVGYGRVISSKAKWSVRKANLKNDAEAAVSKTSKDGTAVVNVPNGTNGGTGKTYTEQNIPNNGIHKLSSENNNSDNSPLTNETKNDTLNVKYKYSDETSEAFRKVFDAQYDRAVKIFGNIDTINTVGVLYVDRKSNVYGEYSDNTYNLNIRYANEPTYTDLMKKITTKNKLSGQWATDNARHAIRHEIGHAIVCQHRISDEEWNNKLSKIRKLWSDDFNSEDSVKTSNLSKYAYQNVDEFIAESIAEYMNSGARQVAIDVINIILGV